MLTLRENPLVVFLKVLVCELVSLAAPVVCLFYRRGWFITPDDLSSPHGQYEPKMRGILARFGPAVNDWWWLGVRNRGYGLRYRLKPALFRNLGTYEHLPTERHTRGRLRITRVAGHSEYVMDLTRLHIIYGYRMTPVYNEIRWNARARDEGWLEQLIPFRPVNMDARPIFSIRMGAPD
jgi:hypothetical protein